MLSYDGWAYRARTADTQIFLAYFENGCPKSEIRGAQLNSTYRAQWFNPRDGIWFDAGSGHLSASKIGVIELPAFPAETDWGLKLGRQFIARIGIRAAKPRERVVGAHLAGARLAG
ncbi:MAG: hypothetical protein ABIZ04_12325 [Opitutus sp.]